MDSAPSSSPLVRDEDIKAELCRPEHCSHTPQRQRLHGKDEKRSSTSRRSAKSDESLSNSEFDSQLILSSSRKAPWSKDKLPKVLCSVNNRFGDPLHYKNCHPAYSLSMFDKFVAKTVAKWAEQLRIQMKMNVFDSFNPISIIGFLSNFKPACDTNGIHEGAAMRPPSFFWKSCLLPP